jgi:hypothetical protein
MTRTLPILVLLFLLAPLAPFAHGEPLKMNDFAYGIPLQVDGDGAIYSLPLPAEVYRRAVRADLGDLRVFNGNGEVVPHLLQRELRSRPAPPRRLAARLYPLPASEGAPGAEELHIAIDREGTLIDFYGGRLPLEGAGAGEYYLLDAGEVEGAVASLHLQWAPVAAPLLTQVTVYGSDDLNHWQLLVEKRTIAALTHQGFALQHASLELPARRMRYYRLHWPPGSQGVSLSGVELALRPEQVTPPGEWQSVTPLDEDNGGSEEGEYEFRLDGHFPVSRVQLRLPQRNSVVQATLYSRADDDAPWQRRHQGLFYELEREGQTLRNEPLELAPFSHPQWRLVVAPGGGGVGRGIPQLELEWHPQSLFFVARGEMPFTLAFGRQQTEAPGALIDPLLRRLDRDEGPARFIKSAQAGAWFELGGEARLRPPPPPLPWQKWLLWALLLGGVGVLAVMVRSLWRQLRHDEMP